MTMTATDEAKWTFTISLEGNGLASGSLLSQEFESPTSSSIPTCAHSSLPATNNELPQVPPDICESFRNDGFAVFSSVLRQELVDDLNHRLEEILRGRYDRGNKPDKTPKIVKSEYKNNHNNKSQIGDQAEENVGREHETKSKSTSNNNNNNNSNIGPLGFSGNLQNVKVLQVINVHKADHLFRKLATSPALGKVVADLAGWSQDDVGGGGGVRLAQDQVWAKPPGAPPLTFHRDSPYFMFTPADVVTVWIALDDMDEEIGPLEYVRKSHLWGDGRVGSANQFFQSDRGMSLLHSAAAREGIASDELEIVSMAGLGAGGISIHDGRTWHGSGSNNSRTRPRRGIGLHFVPANVRFTKDALKSRLWKPYVQGVSTDSEDADDIAAIDIPNEDFPITWSPNEQ